MAFIEVTNKEQFQEIQSKLMDTNRLLNGVLAKKQYAEREKRRSQLTLKELENLPGTTNTYKSIGKMFLYTPLSVINKELKDTITKSDTDLQTFANQQKYLENQIKESEKNLKELIVRR